jgi:hypothetical protein
MKWSDVRSAYPEQWLVIEALEAHTTTENFRIPDKLAVIDTCLDGAGAMKRYRQLHQQYPQREFYFVHTGREALTLRERQWLGVRRGDATLTKG